MVVAVEGPLPLTTVALERVGQAELQEVLHRC